MICGMSASGANVPINLELTQIFTKKRRTKLCYTHLSLKLTLKQYRYNGNTYTLQEKLKHHPSLEKIDFLVVYK